MLPGFRFLLAAIVLSVSIVTFGLGAAALLRAAHEEFASIPARHVTPEPYFAQSAEAPTLAMLRVEPAPQENASVSSPASIVVEEPAPEAVPVPKVETEKLAALNVDAAPPAEPAKPDVAGSEAPAATAPPAPETQVEPKSAETETQPKMAVLDAGPAPTPLPAVEKTAASSEPIVVPAMTGGGTAAITDKPAAKTAALGNPAAPAAAEADTKKPNAKPDRSEARKKQRADRARERRRLAARRARLAAQQAAASPTAAIEQPAGLFGEAAPQTQPATRRR